MTIHDLVLIGDGVGARGLIAEEHRIGVRRRVRA